MFYYFAPGQDQPVFRPPIQDLYLQITTSSYVEMWKAQRDLLTRSRGESAPGPSHIPGNLPTPRTTNADVLHLVEFWSDALAVVDQRIAAGLAIPSGAFADNARRWRTAAAEANSDAAHRDPNQVYQHNAKLWWAIWQLSLSLSATDDNPSPP